MIGGIGSAGVGSGGMVTKVDAARIATGAGISTLLTSLSEVGAALGVVILEPSSTRQQVKNLHGYFG